MGKTTSRNNGCLTHRRQCPCGDGQCYIRVEGDKDEALIEPAAETSLTQGALQTSSEITSVYTPPYVGQSFRSDDEAQDYYTNFARQNGFAIRRERSKGNSAHPLGVYKRELVCYRAGVYVPRKTAELKRQKNKKSTRCKCEAQMIIKKNVLKGAARWMVVHFSNVHNHELLDSEEVRLLPAYRNISAVDRERILGLAKSGCNASVIMKALEMEKGVKRGDLTFTERDLRNFLQSSKNIDRENEGSELLKACKAMKDKNPDFRYEFTLDINDKLEHIVWSYPDSIRAYKVFGDVVVFDTTYHLYAYDRPVGVWFGLDNNGNTIFFACVLLQDERPHSFRWALQSFVYLMDGKYPQTMLTDLDMGLKDAILNVLPNTKHAFSIWHILPKLSSWFSSLLGSQYEKFIAEFRRICNLETIGEFELQWSQMVIEFGLCSDRHIDVLSFHRNYWALPYLRGCFLGGLTTTGFSGSIKSFFKGFLNSETRLKDFVEQVGNAVDFQNQAGEEATMRQNYQNVKIKTCMPIEEHASGLLSHYAFDMFQKEIVASTQYAVFETSRETYLVRHRLKTDGGHPVRCVAEEIYCSCQEFECSGILCRHALRVLSLKNCFALPDKYLLARWRRESLLIPKSSGYRYRSQALRSLASIIIQESSTTKDRFNYVQWHMSKLLAHVRDMPTMEESAVDMEQSSSCDAAVDVVPAQSVTGGRPNELEGVAEVANEA